jgi:hypothetical protein
MQDPTEDATPETFDPTRRRLCTDGSCVGVIGADGRCGECGRTEAQAAAGEEAATTADFGSEPLAEAPEGGVAPGGFDPTRRLCADGSCVGVVGDDGVCRVCGRRAD